MIIIEKEKVELALHVIDLKKAQMIKNNTEKSYADYKKGEYIVAPKFDYAENFAKNG